MRRSALLLFCCCANDGLEGLDQPAAHCELAAMPSSLAMSAPVDGTSRAHLELRAAGSSACSVETVVSDSPVFTAATTGTLPAVLASGDLLDALVTFSPLTRGGVTSRIVVRYDGGRTLEVPVSGMASIAVDCRLEIDPASRVLDFGSLRPGTSLSREARFTNVGTDNCAFGAPVLVAGDTTELTAGPDIIVEPGDTTTLTVGYHPPVAGELTGAVMIETLDTTNDGSDCDGALAGVAGCLALELTGRAVEPECEPGENWLLDDDGDGWGNRAEAIAGSSPQAPGDTPATRGHLVFMVPAASATMPANAELTARARLSRADIVLALDTTGSMVGMITQVQRTFAGVIERLSSEIDDLAFGLTGFGDFPVADSANSYADVPFYLVHRVQTARSSAGVASIQGAIQLRNIMDGPGPWFGVMRGGDEREQAWEALRQIATGIGITYPDAWGGAPHSVPPFNPATAYPHPTTPGEEVGVIGGVGFRANAQPIVVLCGDNAQHDERLTVTSPPSANFADAVAALAPLKARVIGWIPWIAGGREDLTRIANATDAKVSPEVWGSGADRPERCADGKCCLQAYDPEIGPYSPPQPDPVGGECTLVFASDKWGSGIVDTMSQAILGLARGGRFDIAARVADESGDSVDVAASFVDRVEVGCGGTGVDANGDGHPDTWVDATPGSDVCFRVVTRANTSVGAHDSAQTFTGRVQLSGNGLASMNSYPVTFVVPPRDRCAR